MGMTYKGAPSNSIYCTDGDPSQSTGKKSDLGDDPERTISPESGNDTVLINPMQPHPSYERHPQVPNATVTNDGQLGLVTILTPNMIIDSSDSADDECDDANSQTKSTIFIKHNNNGQLKNRINNDNSYCNNNHEPSKHVSQTTYSKTVRIHESALTESTTFAMELIEPTIDNSRVYHQSNSNITNIQSIIGHKGKRTETLGTMIIKEDKEYNGKEYDGVDKMTEIEEEDMDDMLEEMMMETIGDIENFGNHDNDDDDECHIEVNRMISKDIKDVTVYGHDFGDRHNTENNTEIIPEEDRFSITDINDGEHVPSCLTKQESESVNAHHIH